MGSRLILRSGPALECLLQLARESKAGCVVWNRRYEPASMRRDTLVKAGLKEMGIEALSFNASLLREPMEVKTKEGKPYQVYTPFWKAYLSLPSPRQPLPTPKRLAAPRSWPWSEPLEQWKFQPRISWDTGLRAAWSPGEAGAQSKLQTFCESFICEYRDRRDLPGIDGTSRLSPHLHWGEISPQQIWHVVEETKMQATVNGRDQIEVYQKELAWREFGHHLLYHFPHSATKALREEFAHFPWKKDKKLLEAWQRGVTGYPMVDAGMRELWTTGWMHNRVRMIVASFLVKHLLQPWQEGAKWFWDTLVDADLPNNTLGWQWTAGCGADAAPYFRIFNPISQGERFDGQGDYVRRWVPELAQLPTRYIHAPWMARENVLDAAGVRLGKNYPRPIVDHQEARKRALEAYARMRGRV